MKCGALFWKQCLVSIGVVIAGSIYGCSGGSGFAGSSGKTEKKPDPPEEDAEESPEEAPKQDSSTSQDPPGSSLDHDVDSHNVSHAVGNSDSPAPSTPAPPPPTEAEVQGSFSVWTEPKKPIPLSYYWIIIQVKLPSSVKSYPRSDLTGSVIGTDSFREKINPQFNMGQKVQSGPGWARVSIKIPSGQRLIRDTISVRSAIINETQTINIRF